MSIQSEVLVSSAVRRVMGDRVQLQQVLMNLMMNSIDAMKDVQAARELAAKGQVSQ
jgi:C4-dicarboxylate-specific signal transduction histidine kinase